MIINSNTYIYIYYIYDLSGVIRLGSFVIKILLGTTFLVIHYSYIFKYTNICMLFKDVQGHPFVPQIEIILCFEIKS